MAAWDIDFSANGSPANPWDIDFGSGAAITLEGAFSASATTSASLTTAIRLNSAVNTVANTTANLTTAITLNSAVNTAATVTGNLTTQILLAATVNAAVNTTADLTVSAGLASSLSATANTTANLTTQINLAAAVNAAANTTAVLTTAIRLASNLAASANTTANLNTAIRLAAALSAPANTTAALTTQIPLAGSLAATANTTGALTTAIQLNAAVNATVNTTANLTAGADTSLNAAISATANTTANLSTAIRLNSAVNATANVAGNLTTAIRLASALSAVANTTANLTTQIPLAAAVAVSAATTGILTTAIRLASALTATATANATTLQTAIRLAGALQTSANTTAALTTAINLLSSVNASAATTGALTTAINLATAASASAFASASLTTAIQLNAAVDAFANAEADLTIRPAINLDGNLLAEAFASGNLTFGRPEVKPPKPLIKALELMDPTQTNIRGIHQSDIIIRTAIVAGLADMRAKPWLLNYVFASLPKDPLTWKEYGEKNVLEAKKWFLETHVPVKLVPVLNELEIPSITITLMDSSEVVPETTIGDIHYTPAEDSNPFPATLTTPFAPKGYDQKTGIITLKELPATVFLAEGMYILDSVGRYHQILEVIDDLSLKIKPGTVADFSQAVIKASKNPRMGLESSSFRETYRIGIHVGGEPQKLSWLHSFVVFCLMRYKEVLLEARGFERSTIQSSDFGRENPMESELVFSRNITVSGFVRQYWPKVQAPVIDGVQMDAISVSGVGQNSEGVDLTITDAGVDPNTQLWVGNLDVESLNPNKRK